MVANSFRIGIVLRYVWVFDAEVLAEDPHRRRRDKAIDDRLPPGGNLAMQREHVGLEAVVERELDHVARLILTKAVDAAFGR